MTFPTAAELDAQYGHHFDSPAFRALADWREPNHDDALDEQAYLERVQRMGHRLLDKLTEAMDGIKDVRKEG